MSQGNGVANGHGADSVIGSFKVKAGLAQMLKGGVIMDVVNAEQVSHSIKSYIRIFPITYHRATFRRVADRPFNRLKLPKKLELLPVSTLIPNLIQ
jgi:hypothetical protein